MANQSQTPSKSRAATPSARIQELLLDDQSLTNEQVEVILRSEKYPESKPGSFRKLTYNIRSVVRQKLQDGKLQATKNGEHKPAPQPVVHAVKPAAQPAPPPKVQEPVPNDPLQLAIRVRKMATQVGGLAKLREIVDLCKTHGTDKMYAAASLCQTVGLEKFALLVAAAGYDVVTLTQAIGSGKIAEVVQALGQIEEASTANAPPPK